MSSKDNISLLLFSPSNSSSIPFWALRQSVFDIYALIETDPVVKKPEQNPFI